MKANSSIWAHTLVKNEDRYLWFSVTSVIDCVDKMLLWDTGSTDKTLDIIKELIKLYPSKIIYKEVGEVDIDQFTSIRAQMLKETHGDWVLIVDGDEVWWDGTIKALRDEIWQGESLDTVVVGYYNLLGDIFHYDSEKNGDYKIDNIKGHITIRAINMEISGLNVSKPHGQQGFFDGNGKLIQDLPKERRKFIKGKSYLHFTHLSRSSEYDFNVPKRLKKQRKELGQVFPLDFFYPEVFFRPQPTFVPSPWNISPSIYELRAKIISPLRDLKKSLLRSSGY
jgi:glycosyltransferase involved in cell wall biosynthesis